jgi:hypothetical protein
VAEGDDAGERLARGVAGSRCSFACQLCDRRRSRGMCREGLGEVKLEVDVEP